MLIKEYGLNEPACAIVPTSSVRDIAKYPSPACDPFSVAVDLAMRFDAIKRVTIRLDFTSIFP